MALMPKRIKHRMVQRGSRRGLATAAVSVDFGDYGLKSMGRCWLKATQIEACRVAINRYLKRRGRLWVRVFPDRPVSKKAAETRMGKGKGAPEFWVATVKPGTIMFEIGGVAELMAREAMRLAATKLPVPTRFVTRLIQ
ncbi:MAG: 50S ribosomal protein L16 [bacterium]